MDWGTAAPSPTAPIKDGYRFDEWTSPIDDVKDNVTVRPVYVKVFSVTFLDWEDSVISNVIVDINKPATAPTPPSREDYAFTGWDLDFSNVTKDMTVRALYTNSISKITTIYLDEASAEIATKRVKNVPVGTLQGPEVIDIEGYTMKTSDDKRVVKNITEEFKVIYSKNPDEGTLTIEHLNKSGVKIADNIVRKLLLDKPYTIIAQDISGYLTPAKVELTLTKETSDTIVKFVYDTVPVPAPGGGGGGGGNSTPVTEKVIEPTPVVPPVDVPTVPSTGSSDSKSVIKDSGRALVMGYPDKTFKPDNGITRAEASSLIYNLLGLDFYLNSTNEFSDVNEKDWYYKTVSTLSSKEYPIFAGYPDGTFKPNAKITRAEIAVLLVKLGVSEEEINEEIDKALFADVNDHWAKAYITAAAEKGIISTENSIFNPNNSATRAETSTMVFNSIGRAEIVPDNPTFVDVDKDHWAYSKIESIVRESILE